MKHGSCVGQVKVQEKLAGKGSQKNPSENKKIKRKQGKGKTQKNDKYRKYKKICKSIEQTIETTLYIIILYIYTQKI